MSTTLAQEAPAPGEVLVRKNTPFVLNRFPREAGGHGEFKFGWSARVKVDCSEDPQHLPWPIVIEMVPARGALRSGDVLWVEETLLRIEALSNAGATTIEWSTGEGNFVLRTTEDEKRKIEKALEEAHRHRHPR